ncbi:hypothetical protein L6249_02330 [Candidatus Parcubacteria bacterium]|nr:hypothetical protein [Planctomycetota bacterium]MCG2690882.1 hypothetical protein [Candidatus Parcubacteria bacterium]
MTEVPNKEKAYVSLKKLKDYLLSETHSVGKSKAKLLRSFGFNETNVHLLKEGLIAIAQTGKLREALKSKYGVKYIIEGKLGTPDGRSIEMRTVWIIEKKQTEPRFVTAYPL